MNVPSSNPVLFGTPVSAAPLKDLAVIIRSRTPLIAVETNEETTIVNLVRRIGQQFQMKAFRWTVTEGLQAFEPADQPMRSVMKLELGRPVQAGEGPTPV